MANYVIKEVPASIGNDKKVLIFLLHNDKLCIIEKNFVSLYSEMKHHIKRHT